MTKKEMWKRIKKLGGLNPKTALIVSIEKWNGLLEYWTELSEDDDRFPDTPNCALCQQYYSKDCEGCPLDCINDNSQYEKVNIAIEYKDKPAFMKARRNLIRRMQRALKKLEEK